MTTAGVGLSIAGQCLVEMVEDRDGDWSDCHATKGNRCSHRWRSPPSVEMLSADCAGSASSIRHLTCAEVVSRFVTGDVVTSCGFVLEGLTVSRESSRKGEFRMR